MVIELNAAALGEELDTAALKEVLLDVAARADVLYELEDEALS